MYKVLIVDDERDIREGLTAWSWEKIGLQVAGYSAHGLEALQFIADHPVDIVMTDIRMPFMNGIELIEILKRQYPFIHVIILSGHSDFDYAQKAIQHNAADYLLKPVHLPSLSKTFEQLIQKLDAKKQVEYRTSVLQRKEEQLTQVLRNDFLNRLLHGTMSADDIEQASSEGEVLLDSECFTVALFRLDRLSLHKQGISERELRLLVFSLDNILHDLWDSKGCSYHLVNKSTAEFYLLSMKHDPQEEFTALLPQLIKLTGLFKSTFSAAIGQMVQRPSEIHHSARSAELALHRNKEKSSVSFYSAGDFPMEKKEPVPADSWNSPVFKTEREQNSIIIVHAKQYILDHYHRSVTLQEVADHVYVSQGHLSTLFKEAGETYLRFLTSVRMKKAMELLLDPCIKVYEIVERVGYTDPAYFSEVFKKYIGKTPNEFRGKSKHMQEES